MNSESIERFETYLTEVSPVKLRIIQFVSDGLTNKEIGEKLSLTESTVKKYLSEIYEESGIPNRTILALSYYLLYGKSNFSRW